jgi:hypothetical protein
MQSFQYYNHAITNQKFHQHYVFNNHLYILDIIILYYGLLYQLLTAATLLLRMDKERPKHVELLSF